MNDIAKEKSSLRKDLYIIGAGGFGRETAWLVERINDRFHIWNLKGFIDDDPSTHGKISGGLKVWGDSGYLKTLSGDFYVVCAIGNAAVRRKKAEQLSGIAGLHFATLTDPSVKMSDSVKIGEGSIICAGSALTTDIEAGAHNIINLNCTIGHDVVLEDFVTLYPGVNVSGKVRIGAVSEIGTGSCIIQGITLGAGTITGAGTTVVRNLPGNCTAVGCPAGIIKKREPVW